MSDQSSAAHKARVFISYASQDQKIADRVCEILSLHYRGQVYFFLDSKSIVPGQKWRTRINQELEQANILLVLYTGEKSDYVGFEVGTFLNARSGKAVHEDAPLASSPASVDLEIGEGSVVVIRNTASLPALFADIQDVEIPSVENIDALGTDDAWLDTHIGRAVLSLSQYKGLYPPPPANAGGQVRTYRQDHAKLARDLAHIFHVMGRDTIVNSKPLQDEMRVVVKAKKGSGSLDCIPSDACLNADRATWRLFDLDVSPDDLTQVTWGSLRESQLQASAGRQEVPWMEKIDQDVARVVKNKALEGDKVSFVSGERVYRAILARQDVMRSGDRILYIQFVETLKRHFPGLARTSRLLGSIVMASRYHFTYIEDWSAFKKKFSANVSDEEFFYSCRSLLVDFDRIEHEGLELGLGDPGGVTRAFGDKHKGEVEGIFQTYFAARKKLDAVIVDLVLPLPLSKRMEVLREVKNFLQVTMKSNFRFLELALGAYSDDFQDIRRKFNGLSLDIDLEKLGED